MPGDGNAPLVGILSVLNGSIAVGLCVMAIRRARSRASQLSFVVPVLLAYPGAACVRGAFGTLGCQLSLGLYGVVGLTYAVRILRHDPGASG